jgi:hypothetical protein
VVRVCGGYPAVVEFWPDLGQSRRHHLGVRPASSAAVSESVAVSGRAGEGGQASCRTGEFPLATTLRHWATCPAMWEPIAAAYTQLAATVHPSGEEDAA